MGHIDRRSPKACACIKSLPGQVGHTCQGRPDAIPMQETDGRAFLVRSVNNQFVGISQLNDAYTNTTGLVSVAPKVIFSDSIISLFHRHVLLLGLLDAIVWTGHALHGSHCCASHANLQLLLHEVPQ